MNERLEATVARAIQQRNEHLETAIRELMKATGADMRTLSLVEKREGESIRWYFDTYPEGQSEIDSAKIKSLKAALEQRDAEIVRSQGQRDAARETVNKLLEEGRKQAARIKELEAALAKHEEARRANGLDEYYAAVDTAQRERTQEKP